MVIAMMIEEALQDLGCVVVGPVAKLDAALRLARDEVLDAAILDVTIRGGQVFRLPNTSSPAAFRSCWRAATATGLCPRTFRTSPA